MAAISKLDPLTIKNTKAGAKEIKLSDGGGLYLRVRPSGAKSWIFRFRLGKSRRLHTMTLGSLQSLSAKNARAKLPELRQLVGEGIDPRSARAATKMKNSEAISMQKLFDEWIEFMKLTKAVSAQWVKRHEDRWRLHLKIPLGAMLAKDITRTHLANALDAMTRRGIKEETRKALTTLNLMLDYGLTRHAIENNPARALKPKDFAASANRSRDRALTMEELKHLWLALDEATQKRKGIAKTSTMRSITAVAIKLLILTGARRGEVAGMQWNEINLEKGEWRLPAARTKNRHAHTIYLGKLAIDLIKSLQPLTGCSQFVFDTGRDNNHIHTDSLNTAINRLRTRNRNVPESAAIQHSHLSEIVHFTIHDIRRSAATMWGEHLKIAPHIIERMLNHQPLNKLIATYQRATYTEEQRTAWLRWDKLVRLKVATHLPIKKFMVNFL